MYKKNQTRVVATLVFAALATVALRAEATHPQPSAAVIIEWNDLLQRNVAVAPFPTVRIYAITHIAMADAVAAIRGPWAPYHARLWAPHGASAEAAAAQAAHDVLLFFAPGGATSYTDTLNARLATIPPGPRRLGVEVGKRAAQAILDWRSTDGFATANPQPPTFLASTLPGIWRQTTPGAAGAAQFSELGSVVPFGLLTSTQFLPTAFPQLESAEYATDFNEVKSKGKSTSTTRTAEETRFAQLFASAGPFVNVTNAFRLWNNAARDVAADKGYGIAATARLFALLNASMFDGLQTSQTSKFVYRLWRPVTAVAGAGTDNNDATETEDGWTPLLGTPPYPSHASNMQCIGASAAKMLANVFGDDAQSFTATWYLADGTVVHAEPYESLWQMALDEGDSRVWGGIHFRFELVASQVSCSQVADYLFDNYMQPRHHH